MSLSSLADRQNRTWQPRVPDTTLKTLHSSHCAVISLDWPTFISLPALKTYQEVHAAGLFRFCYAGEDFARGSAQIPPPATHAEQLIILEEATLTSLWAAVQSRNLSIFADGKT